MLAAALLLQVVAAAPVFAPPLGTPFRLVTERAETGAVDRNYRLERLVRFARAERGYRAEVRILRTASNTPEASGALYEAGFGALAGRTLVFHLDAAGKVEAIDDLASIWDRLCLGVATNVATRRNLPPEGRAALAERIAAPLRAMPADRQRALLGSLVSALVAEEAGEPLGTRPMRLPGTLPFGTVTMDGKRTLAPAGAQIESVIRAAGDLALPAEGTAPARPAHIEVETHRTFDPRTGLVAKTVETTRTALGTGAETRRVTTVQVMPADAGTWTDLPEAARGGAAGDDR